MDATKGTRELKLKHWAEIIHKCKASDLSAKEWLNQNGIPRHQFYYWQRQLRSQALETLHKDDGCSKPVQTLVEINCPDASGLQKPSADIAANGPAFESTPVLSIRIADATVDVRKNTTPELLRMVLQEIRHAERS